MRESPLERLRTEMLTATTSIALDVVDVNIRGGGVARRGPCILVCRHAEPPGQAAQGGLGHREAGQGSGAQGRKGPGHGQAEAGVDLGGGAAAAGDVRAPGGRAGRGAPQGGGEEGRGAATVRARPAAAAAGRGEPRARTAGRGELPLRQAQRQGRPSGPLPADGEAPGERRGGRGGGSREPGARGGARRGGEADLRGGQAGGAVLVRSGEADRLECVLVAADRAALRFSQRGTSWNAF